MCCAIATEFAPVLMDEDSATKVLYVYKLCGFAFGVALMFGVEIFGDYYAEKLEREQLPDDGLTPGNANSGSRTSWRRMYITIISWH